MPIAWWGLVGLFSATLVNRAADCWLSPVWLECGLTRHPFRQVALWVGLPVFYMLLAWRIPASEGSWPVALFATVLITLAVIDWEQRRLPNVVILPAALLALVDAQRSGELGSALLAALLALVVFLALYGLGYRLLGPGALGMGDVKLAALIGAMTGLEWVAHALLAGVLLAGVVAGFMLATGRARRGDSLPYGSYLALMAVVVLVIAI